jgi:ABC-type antimicrobial peptide transport system permease subunit
MQTMIYELRTAGNPLSYVRTVRELIHEVDPRLPVSEIQTQSELIDATINREVVFARLCTGFALLALVIACVGLYGAMSYNVARRTGEIGIRMALGAPRGRVVWMVLREVLLLAATGLVISVPAALFGTKLLKSFLYETQPNDPISLTVAAVSLVVAATLAGYLPARKASCIDPMVALRHE